MRGAGRDVDDVGEPDAGGWSDLQAIIVAPALDGSRLATRARVLEPEREPGDLGERELRGGWLAALDRRIAEQVRLAVADDRAVANTARVVGTDRELADAGERGDLGRRLLALPGVEQAGCPVATPARDGAGLAHRARGGAAGADRDRIGDARHERLLRALGAAELAIAVVAPAQDDAGREPSAGVIVAGGDLDRRCNAGDYDRLRRIGWWVVVPARLRRAVPELELAVVSIAPAQDAAIAHQRAAVIIAERDLRDLGEPGDLDRSSRRGERAVAELAAIVLAPAPHLAALEEAAVIRAERELRGSDPNWLRTGLERARLGKRFALRRLRRAGDQAQHERDPHGRQDTLR